MLATDARCNLERSTTKKKMKLPLSIIPLALLLVGCGVPKEKFEALEKELATVKAQLAEKDKALAVSNAKGESIAGQLAEVSAKLAAASATVAATEAKVAELAPLAKKARTLPVIVTTRKAIFGSGQVLELQNTTGAPLPVVVKAHSGTFGDTNKNFILRPNITEQIGHAELHDFLTGDTAEITSDGFDTVTKQF